MFMDRECIADVGIWSAKKRYMLNVYDSEGVRYETPKPKIMGYSMIKSSLPEICRDKLKKEFVPVIIGGENDTLIDMVKEFRQEWRKLLPNEVSRPTTVRGLEKYEDSQTIYGKGTPGHVRAALLYNHYHAKMKLGSSHDIIHSGDKIKWVYLKTPNPIGDNVIAFHDFLPHELGLDAYVDYDLMFQKLFLQPLEEVTIPIKWHTEKVSTLDFFLQRQITLDNAEEVVQT
jgi:DNA polymerase elongation subunit (family B)